ncbi:MAG TPA: DUF883 family protein [Cellvibrio sp.]|nr:DUF883 family protein [Cellvibrio sp.]
MSFLSNSAKSEINDTKHQIQHASQDISKEFKSFLSDVENLYKATTSLTGEDLAKAKAKLNQRIQSAKEVVGESSANILQQARKTATVTNEYVHEKPWTVIGATAAAGFLLGFLLSRRD